MATLTRMEIRDLRPLDWPEVAAIYEDGIRTGNATFETGVPSWARWDAAHSAVRLVAELDGKTAGWAALMPSSDRGCYRGVAENARYGFAVGSGQRNSIRFAFGDSLYVGMRMQALRFRDEYARLTGAS